MATVPRFAIERAVDRQIGVGIGEEADAALAQGGDSVRQPGIARLAPPPVPEEAAPEAGLAHPAPVFAPQAPDHRAGCDDRVKAVEAFEPFLETDNSAFKGPVGQGRGPAKKVRKPRNEVRQRGCGENREASLAFPDFDQMRRRIGEIEHRIGGRFQVNGAALRGQEGRLRVISRPIVATRVAGRVHRPGEVGRLVAPDPRFAGPHREAPAIQHEIAHLFAAAPHRLAPMCREADSQPVEYRVCRADRQAGDRIPLLDDEGGEARPVRSRRKLPLPFARPPATAWGHRPGRFIDNIEVAPIHRDPRSALGKGDGRVVSGMAQNGAARDRQRQDAPALRRLDHRASDGLFTVYDTA